MNRNSAPMKGNRLRGHLLVHVAARRCCRASADRGTSTAVCTAIGPLLHAARDVDHARAVSTAAITRYMTALLIEKIPRLDPGVEFELVLRL